MEIKINIDESRFQEVLEKELEAFSKDEIHEILAEAMKEYLNKENILENYLNKCEVDRWGSIVKGTSVMEKLINNVDLSDVLAEPKEKIKEIITRDDILKSTAIELLAGIFKDRYRSAMLDYNFINEVSSLVAQNLSNRNGK